MTQTVNLEITQKVAYLTLNRPKAMNSYNEAMADQLLAATETILNHPELKYVVFKGEGKAFMAGGDIGYFKENLSELSTMVRPMIRKLASTIHNIQQANAIYLCVAHGAVAGAGMSLMLACDLVLADNFTTVTTAYSRLGTSPDGGLSYFRPKLVGAKKAMEMLLLSERLTTSDMLSLGLINASSDTEALAALVDSWCSKLNNLPMPAAQHIKKLINQSVETSLASQLELEAEFFSQSTASKAFAEGVNAFVEKRPPEFK